MLLALRGTVPRLFTRLAPRARSHPRLVAAQLPLLAPAAPLRYLADWDLDAYEGECDVALSDGRRGILLDDSGVQKMLQHAGVLGVRLHVEIVVPVRVGVLDRVRDDDGREPRPDGRRIGIVLGEGSEDEQVLGLAARELDAQSTSELLVRIGGLGVFDGE